MHPRHFLLTCFLTVLWSQAPASGAQLATIPLTVRVYDGAGLSDATRAGALSIATGALAAAGIDAVWRRCDVPRSAAGCDAPPGGDELVIRIVTTRTASSLRMTLGDALIDRASGQGQLATIYVDRVLRLARAASADAARLLGYAIAHELGHLLMATGAHSRDGLMRAVWSDEQVRQSRDEDWRFTRRDIAVIRARSIAGRMAHIVWGD